MFLLIFTVNSTGFGITCKTSLGICLRGHSRESWLKRKCPTWEWLVVKYVVLCAWKTARHLIHLKHLFSALECSHVRQCPEVALLGASCCLSHIAVTHLELLHFPSIFPMFTRQGSFQTFLQGSSKLLINLQVDYIFYCFASSHERSLWVEKTNCLYPLTICIIGFKYGP